MDYIKNLEQAILYIEKNLSQDLDIRIVAKEIGYSYYHFTRIFESVLGESVGNYIRKRRLSKSVEKLLFSDDKIIDIAFECGYESSEAYSRAFKAIYQVSPNAYRQNRIDVLKGNKRILEVDLINHLDSIICLKPKVIIIDEIKVVGIEGKTNLKEMAIPKLWQDFRMLYNTIPGKAIPYRTFGICLAEQVPYGLLLGDETTYSEFVGVEVETFSRAPNYLKQYTISGGRYAVFTYVGSLQNLKKTYEYIWGTWLVISGEELGNRPDFELYDERFLGQNNENSEFDIYIPLK